MQIAQTFYENGIRAVIGHWSTNVSYFVEDIYENNEVIMLTPRATGLNLLETNYNYIFRMTPNNQNYAEAIAKYMVENGFERVAMFYSEDEYGNDFSRVLENVLFDYGIKVIDRISDITARTEDGIFRRWQAFGCDGVVFAASYPKYINALEKISAKYTVFGADNFNYIPLRESQVLSNASIYSTTIPDESIDSQFLQTYIQKYGHKPDLAAIYGYQAVMLIKDAMEATGTIDSTTMANYFTELSNYQTVSGTISHNKDSQEFEHFDGFEKITFYAGNKSNTVS